ncbi:MAG TPA: 3-dehydroquinate synthase [Pyrinomonadaceae bacterium]|nr:3-dehydroquinate synthase [Pyrinomonadaceae bacterium]
MTSLQVRTPSRAFKYKISLGRGLLSRTGELTRESLGRRAMRVAVFSNKTVFSLYGPQVIESLSETGFSVSHWLMGDGERFKSIRTTQKALLFLNEINLDRNDGVIALGGGVVGDLAGFAAAVYLRGIPFIQIPTTLLAQVDSSVGGKTGVNMPGGKNLIGSFHQPRAVIIDLETLTTLPTRELAAGWFETVKQGAVASRKLFQQTTDFLQGMHSKEDLISSRLSELIAAQVSFKAAIVAADEREDLTRTDHRSRKILNFGHTIGHGLEAITNYRRFRHGEAVGHGMLAAGALSKNLGLLDKSELELLREGVHLCGPLPSAENLEADTIITAIARDKKRSSGDVQWVLLERIGLPRLVDGKEISRRLLKQSLREALRKS